MRKKIFIILISLIVLGITAPFLADVLVAQKTKNTHFFDLKDLPNKKVGLVLGTSKYLSNGNINLYYKYRIDATVELFNAGKIQYILVSGDNRKEHYNEPETMKADLIAAGIPEDKIVLDYAGFRTLDSMLRCKEVFGETDIIVISQKFHNERAIYIAQANGMNVLGYNAKDVNKKAGIKVAIREKFARVKMLLDLTFNKQAKFYGPKIDIP